MDHLFSHPYPDGRTDSSSDEATAMALAPASAAPTLDHTIALTPDSSPIPRFQFADMPFPRGRNEVESDLRIDPLRLEIDCLVVERNRWRAAYVELQQEISGYIARAEEAERRVERMKDAAAVFGRGV